MKLRHWQIYAVLSVSIDLLFDSDTAGVTTEGSSNPRSVNRCVIITGYTGCFELISANYCR